MDQYNWEQLTSQRKQALAAIASAKAEPSPVVWPSLPVIVVSQPLVLTNLHIQDCQVSLLAFPGKKCSLHQGMQYG